MCMSSVCPHCVWAGDTQDIDLTAFVQLLGVIDIGSTRRGRVRIAARRDDMLEEDPTVAECTLAIVRS